MELRKAWWRRLSRASAQKKQRELNVPENPFIKPSSGQWELTRANTPGAKNGPSIWPRGRAGSGGPAWRARRREISVSVRDPAIGRGPPALGRWSARLAIAYFVGAFQGPPCSRYRQWVGATQPLLGLRASPRLAPPVHPRNGASRGRKHHSRGTATSARPLLTSIRSASKLRSRSTFTVLSLPSSPARPFPSGGWGPSCPSGNPGYGPLAAQTRGFLLFFLWDTFIGHKFLEIALVPSPLPPEFLGSHPRSSPQLSLGLKTAPVPWHLPGGVKGMDALHNTSSDKQHGRSMSHSSAGQANANFGPVHEPHPSKTAGPRRSLLIARRVTRLDAPQSRRTTWLANFPVLGPNPVPASRQSRPHALISAATDRPNAPIPPQTGQRPSGPSPNNNRPPSLNVPAAPPWSPDRLHSVAPHNDGHRRRHGIRTSSQRPTETDA